MWTIHEIQSRKPWLIHYNTDVYNIEERLREIDDGYRVFWNVKKEKFEIHNLNSRGSTICISADRLDARVIDRINQSYVGYHGDKLDKIDDHNKMVDEYLEKQRRKQLEEASLDTYGPLKRANLKDELHAGYESRHFIQGIEGIKGGVKQDDRSKDKGNSATND